LRLALKHARDNVRRRVLATEVMDKYRKIIEQMEPRIRQIFDEEYSEKQVRGGAASAEDGVAPAELRQRKTDRASCIAAAAS